MPQVAVPDHRLVGQGEEADGQEEQERLLHGCNVNLLVAVEAEKR